jgi:predicted DNA-binding protein
MPEASDTKPINLRISTKLHERLTAISEDRMVGMNKIVTKAIEKYLGELEGHDPLAPTHG